jgi:homoserine O-acetyltransferase
MHRAPIAAVLLAACSSHSRDEAGAASGSASAAAAPVKRAPPPPAVFPLPDVKPVEGDFTLRDFHFKDGETLPELRIHYTTIGTLARDAAGHATNAVLVMHGTGGDGHQFYRPQFAKELFAPGEPLDVTKYFIILPDDVGHGRSSKPSDGLRARFPHYVYDDMVAAEHALVADGLHVDHLRLVMGTSMGCMHAWMWAEDWPQMMDAVMPLACLPVAIVGRNRLWRRMIVEGIRSDPDWKGGDYETEPRGALMLASAVLQIAGSAPLAQQAKLATRDAVDKELADNTKRFLETADANDTLYQVDSSTDYDPSAGLEKITAPVMYVNSTDDFINPPELGIAEQQITRVPHGQLVILQGNADTHGHGTHTWAKHWKQYLVQLLAASQASPAR